MVESETESNIQPFHLTDGWVVQCYMDPFYACIDVEREIQSPVFAIISDLAVRQTGVIGKIEAP